MKSIFFYLVKATKSSEEKNEKKTNINKNTIFMMAVSQIVFSL